MSFMALTILFVAMGDVATVRTILPMLPFIAHEMLATAGAGVLHLGFAFEQVAMGIPPSHTASVSTEAALSMPWAENENLTTLDTDAVVDWASLFFMGRSANITQTK